jgi:hypothetical protein
MIATTGTIEITGTTDLTGQLQSLHGWYFRETSRTHSVEINLRAASKTGPIKVHIELDPGAAQSESGPRPMLFVDAGTAHSPTGVYVEVIGDGTVEGNLIPA